MRFIIWHFLTKYTLHVYTHTASTAYNLSFNLTFIVSTSIYFYTIKFYLYIIQVNIDNRNSCASNGTSTFELSTNLLYDRAVATSARRITLHTYICKLTRTCVYMYTHLFNAYCFHNAVNFIFNTPAIHCSYHFLVSPAVCAL